MAAPSNENDRRLSPTDIAIEEVDSDHPDWRELVQVIDEENQTHWAFEKHFEPFARHFVAAKLNDRIVGFLMFVVWDIGPHDRGYATLKFGGKTLTEAKIIAFGVRKDHRRRGIGRALQEYVLNRARELGCYQVRSVSGNDHPENRNLKLSMGFAVEPMERDEPSLAFVMPLRSDLS